jgi:DNA-binding protein H-NS
MNSRKLQTLLRPTRSRMVYENHNLINQLQKLSREEKHSRIWTWVKQGTISYQQFSFLLNHLEKDALSN